MGGSTNIAGTLALSAVLILVAYSTSPSFAGESAPVVSMKQPMSLVSRSCSTCGQREACDCDSSVIGLDETSIHATASTSRDFELPASHVTLADAGPFEKSQTSLVSFVWSNNSARGCDDCNSTGCCKLASPCDSKGVSSGDSACIDWSCIDLCSQQGFWIRTEALLWWSESDDVPTLATSSPLGTLIGDAGVLGLPTTTNLFDSTLFGDMRPGGRVRFGWWADKCHHGIDGSFWGLQNDRDVTAWSSAGDPAYARPFNNVDPLVNAQDSQLIGFEDVLDGTLTINSSSEILGGDIGIRKNLMCCSDFCNRTSTRLDCYLGYSYFKVREGIRVTENVESIALVGPTVLGTQIDLYDDFQTRNEFHGVNIGVVAAKQHGRWATELTSRVLLGNLSRQVTIDGSSTVTVPGLPPVANSRGLLAQSTNIGVYEDNKFTVVPEIQANLSYNVRQNTRLKAGYTFMYLGNVVRPGDTIDTSVNGLLLDPSLPLSGSARPDFAWSDSEMWLMGLSLGVEFDF